MEKRLVLRYLALYLIIILLFASFVFLRYVSITGFAVFHGEEVTLILQEEGENLGDVHVKRDVGNRNFGLNEELHVKWGTPKRNIYIGFNISLIPSEQQIDGALLCLYLFNDQGSQTISAYHVYSNWNEGNLDGQRCQDACNVMENITWNNQPCGDFFDNSSACNITEESFVNTNKSLDNTWQCWNVVDIVRKDYYEGKNKVSIVLHTEDTGKADKFYSKEYLNESLRPYLNITYHALIFNNAPVITLIKPENITYNYTLIDLEFSVSDEDENIDSCWYDVVKENSSFSDIILNCENSSLELTNGNYTLNVYANDSFGETGEDSVNFIISLPEEQNETAEEEEETPPTSSSSGGGGGGGGRKTSAAEIVSEEGEIALLGLEDVIANPGEEKTLDLSVENLGEVLLSECKLSENLVSGISGQIINDLDVGEKEKVSFVLNVPDDFSDNEVVDVVIECGEIKRSKAFNLLFSGNIIGVDLFSNDYLRNRFDFAYLISEKVGKEQEIEAEYWFETLDGLIISEGRENISLMPNGNYVLKGSSELPGTGEYAVKVNLKASDFSVGFEDRIVVKRSIGIIGRAILVVGGWKITGYALAGVVLVFLVVYFVKRMIKKPLKIDRGGFVRAKLNKKVKNKESEE